jgi:hypothetical protein
VTENAVKEISYVSVFLDAWREIKLASEPFLCAFDFESALSAHQNTKLAGSLGSGVAGDGRKHFG